MRLVYVNSGAEVKVGDRVHDEDGVTFRVDGFSKPHKPASSGKVEITTFLANGEEAYEGTFYVSVIGAEWIEREDRE